MTRKLTRREALRLGAIGGGAVLLPTAIGRAARGTSGPRLSMAGGSGGQVRSPIGPPFEAELALAPVLAPVRRDASGDHYAVSARASASEIIPGLSTPHWGYE